VCCQKDSLCLYMRIIYLDMRPYKYCIKRNKLNYFVTNIFAVVARLTGNSRIKKKYIYPLDERLFTLLRKNNQKLTIIYEYSTF